MNQDLLNDDIEQESIPVQQFYRKYVIDINKCPLELYYDILQIDFCRHFQSRVVKQFVGDMNNMFDAKQYGTMMKFSGLKADNMPESWKTKEDVWFPRRGHPVGMLMDEMTKSVHMFHDNKFHATMHATLKKHGFKANERDTSIEWKFGKGDNSGFIFLTYPGLAPEDSTNWIVEKDWIT